MAPIWEPSARREQVAREDLTMFINACFACTGQREFYSDANAQQVSIDFLHQYILGNYRLLYARTLAAGVNHFNQAQIILNLLATGRDTSPSHRAEENRLIGAGLRLLPPHRAWRVLETLRERKINNRRARAVVRDFLTGRRDAHFEAVKYRAKVRAAVRHTHVMPSGELAEIGPFLFRGWQKRVYQNGLLEHFRQAHYSADGIYRLPYTVAEGLAHKHGIPRDVFLKRIAGQMTHGEKLRLQKTAAREKAQPIAVEWPKLPLTRLCLYVLSLTNDEREAQRDALMSGLQRAARMALRHAPLGLHGLRVASVLDASYSASGSCEKRRRPLAVALGVHFLLVQAAGNYRAYWTGLSGARDPLLMRAHGQTDLATPLLNALEAAPDLIVIVSDGCENDPPQGAGEVLRIVRTKLDTMGSRPRAAIVHCNPVFDPEDFTLRALSPHVPTVGLRDAEDLPTMLGFARFADGSARLAELEAYLSARVTQMLGVQAGDLEEGDLDAGE